MKVNYKRLKMLKAKTESIKEKMSYCFYHNRAAFSMGGMKPMDGKKTHTLMTKSKIETSVI